MYPKDQLEQLDEELDQMIAETPDCPRLGELKNLKGITTTYIHLLSEDLSEDLLKEAEAEMKNVRTRVAELQQNPESAGLHDVAVKAMETEEEKA